MKPPYYAVIFTSTRTPDDDAGYAAAAAEMERLAYLAPGFLGIESARNPDGAGITVSYWSSLEAIRDWRAHVDHQAAQQAGRDRWYSSYRVRVALVERDREHP